MPKATENGGKLQPLKDCYIDIPDATTIKFYSLPEIGDSKEATYGDEAIIGRASPLRTYSHSGNRTISITIHCIVDEQSAIDRNIRYIRALESALYPRKGEGGAPFSPPPVCSIKCGTILADKPLCAILLSCSVKFPTDVAWDENTLCPYKFDIDTTWNVVYASDNLPGQDIIFQSGG